MIAALKFLHIAAIAIWAGGLLSLPALYVQRAHVRDDRALYQLQMIVRFSYVAVISPAAFLAVGSGIALIFGQQTFTGWFSVKLFFVALLVMLHVLTGLVIIRLFREGEVYPVWRFLLATAVTGAVVLIILFVVLAKPALTVELNRDILEPGGLQRLIRTLSPWPLP
ncbi:CopD family protein [Pseudorhizobium flavum]|uniref:Protoporphyrinogen IX oxidase n=1 Tax=Pseudorhizobium flavum TaxID=1335061 RepID=A0A7W9YZT8_9HYPH|nr:CopD family protein [Pseudorhizobium flavum]MBB6181282.1 putative membrane protein [Pseudorhizobium flavum]CAD6618163.1 membrane protein [Pseudorhizobium flavum]